MASIQKYSEQTFENIKHIDENDIEYWLARELQVVLAYSKWENFAKVIERAKTACLNSDIPIQDHFPDVGKMVTVGSEAQREIEDIKLSRYACYLIVQNADARKKVVALGQTYFAIQTRRQEETDQFELMDEDERRIALRQRVRGFNSQLAATAKDAGVVTHHEFATFQNSGYKGLYAGETARDIHQRKNLSKNQDILDHMASTELAANLFRITQTEEVIRQNQIKGKENANLAHYRIGQEVRDAIRRIGGTMPEALPMPSKSIKQLEKERKQLQRLKDKRK